MGTSKMGAKVAWVRLMSLGVTSAVRVSGSDSALLRAVLRAGHSTRRATTKAHTKPARKKPGRGVRCDHRFFACEATKRSALRKTASFR